MKAPQEYQLWKCEYFSPVKEKNKKEKRSEKAIKVLIIKKPEALQEELHREIKREVIKDFAGIVIKLRNSLIFASINTGTSPVRCWERDSPREENNIRTICLHRRV